jgi:anti-sigma regulatory factor (Ser/Thr protein kinase)
LRHQAFFYEGVDAFVSETLPFVEEGLRDGDPIVVVAKTNNLAALREGLGDEAERVSLHDAQTWYSSPGKAFSACLEFVGANSDASRIRAIGEVNWPVDWAEGIDEYAHYEAVFNVIAREAPVYVVCPYDVSALPDAIIAHARATHPEIRTVGNVHPSDEFVDPDEYCSRLANRLHTAPPGKAIEVTSDLAELRYVVGTHALDANVPRQRIAELLLAVHEIAVNALTHGGGTAIARLWTDERRFVCDIENEGAGLSETTAGYVPPDPGGEGGRGLWLARQVCDLVEVLSRGGTTRVRLSMSRAAEAL